MIIGPKYKICKRLGSAIFEQCQTQRFQLSQARTSSLKQKGGRRGGSDYKRQLIEKQKMRLTYGLTEKQFSNYVRHALERHTNPAATLFELLETRLDSAAYRMGLAGTRRAARQLVSHGHLTVNGKRVTTPSYRVSVGDTLSIREGSRDGALFGGLSEKLAEYKMPSWVSFDSSSKEGALKTLPSFAEQDAPADLGAVFEYYTR